MYGTTRDAVIDGGVRKVIALMLAAGLVMTGAAAAAAESGSTQFEGVAVGSISFPSETECQNNEGMNLRTDGLAMGVSTVIGPTTLATAHCTPEGPDIAGEATLTSASGDELRLEYAGANSPPDPDTGVILSPTDFVVVGGSGRFEGAQGAGTITAYVLFEGFEDPEWLTAWAWTGELEH